MWNIRYIEMENDIREKFGNMKVVNGKIRGEHCRVKKCKNPQGYTLEINTTTTTTTFT